MSKEHCSLPSARRLQELGFRGEHEKLWISWKSAPWYIDSKQKGSYARGYKSVPAYTFTELWREMPTWCRAEKGESGLTYIQAYQPIRTASTKAHESPAEAAALMLIWLIENGHKEVA